MNRKITLKPTNGWRHFWVLVMLILLNVHKTYAQPASSYGFTPVGGTYTEITTGTTIGALLADDGTFSGIPIGFTFNYCGTDYLTLRACSNGWVSFDPANTANQWTNSLANLTQIKPALMALWDDLGGNGTGATQSEARYLTTGTAPNRVFTIQYKNWQWNVGSTPSISFQIKLYETTNIIEYIYRQETANNNSTTATIGICDGAGTPTYLSLNNSTASATASSTAFNTNIGVKPATGQIFRFTPPPPCNTITTWPAATAATIFPSSICGTGSVSLNITTAMPITTGLTYQWQSSPTGAAPWTNVGTAGTTPATVINNVSSTLYFRCLVLCLGNTAAPVWTSNASPQLVVNNPGSPAVTPGTRCGPGTVVLGATPTANGPTLRWYTAPTGGMPVATGTSFTTNFITANTTYYVTAGTALSSGTQAVGAGALTSPTQDVTLFSSGWGGSKHQYLIRANELAAMGMQPGSIINSIAVDVVTGGVTYPGFAISMKNTATTTQAAAYEGGVTEVKTPADHTTTVGLNTFTLTTPFTWDGTSSLLIQTCWSNNTTNSTGSTVKCDNTTYNSTFRGQADSQTPAGMCGLATPSTSAILAQRPQFTFSYDASCQGPRVPVLATVTPSPAVTKTFPAVVCSNEIANITVNSNPITNYTNYAWTPLANLYNNATATVPYAGGNATTVYMKSTDAGQKSFYLYASNAVPSACAFADTVRIWVQPDSITIAGSPDTICNSGTTTLSLVPNTNYAPNSIQWQESTDGGVTYNNIAGANGVNYTTPSLTANRYYKALIRSTNGVCESPVKLVIVSHPALAGAPDSFHCGPGSVVLTANTAGFSTAVWYENPTGGVAVGSGSPWTTPFLSATTTYYVAASGGTFFGTATVGAGALTSATQSATPFSSGWGGSKHEYLIRANELVAAGIAPGSTLNSIALDIVAGGILYPGFAISMKNTSTTALTTTYEGGAVEVKAPANHTTTVGINNFVLTTPFVWDGSNLLIQTCWSNQTTNSTGSTVRMDNTTYVSSRRGQSDSQTPANMCSMAGPSSNATYTARPKFIFNYAGRCETAREEVKAYIRPVPEVDLGADINRCVDVGDVEVLDAGVQPNGPQFLWDNGSASQVRAVTQSGTYSVEVTNEFGCKGDDTVIVVFRRNPVVHLGNDTTVCNGVSLPLNAGPDGVDYFWSTGQTVQTITVNAPGTYNVFVTNAVGCIKTDTITVNMAGELPTIQGINATNNGINSFQFTAVNPQNVIGYDWDFGDGSPHAYSANPTHVYADPGNYIVTLLLSSSCGFLTDSASAHIVGIHQLNVSNDELTVYPNPAKSTATILNRGALKMESVAVYNVLGQVVYKAAADSKEKHTLQLNGFASGIYTIQVFTDKGTVPRKLEILK